MRKQMIRLMVLTVAMCLANGGAFAAEFYIAPGGDDANPGVLERPFATLQRAQEAARQTPDGEAVTVYLRGGTYYLPQTLVFTSEDSGTQQAPVTYVAYPGETPVLSGGVRLDLQWQPFRDGIVKAAVPADPVTDQLFVNGARQPMARYPNFDSTVRHFNGFAADAFSPARAARWADPRGGLLHAMHAHEWGDFHYLITGKGPDNQITYEGGWQNNRRMGMHKTYRMVENIFEELDAPGEWFHDAKTHVLYFYPSAGLDLSGAVVEAVRLKHLIEFQGAQDQPVRFIRLQGLTFRHAARTFMENKEPLLRSDWTTYRGGAILFHGAEDCAVRDCTLDQVGGNAVFVDKHNRRIVVRGCHIVRAGANGVAFVGDPNAVRNPLFEYNQRQSYHDIDKTPGPRTDNYPADCLVEDCLIHETGRVEKQTAPIQISMSMGVTVRHCSIYDVPRAGINISEGTFGGHVIEFCDVFDTVLETGDHGSFNSWGRDRYWGLKDIDLDAITLGTDPNLSEEGGSGLLGEGEISSSISPSQTRDARRESRRLDSSTKSSQEISLKNASPIRLFPTGQGADRDLPILDIVQPNILRNNRWRCDHGWDIDLDDGSSRYEIRNNLCLAGGLKLREGFYRVVENNVIVNNSFHPHVWYAHSEDVFARNIVFTDYRPIQVRRPWGKECDSNVLHKPGRRQPSAAVTLQQASGLDAHSVEADAMFVDPGRGDYRVRPGSPALALGFQNFPMDQFGVQSPSLKAVARTPRLPDATAAGGEPGSTRDASVVEWLGAKVRNVVGLGEVSAAGLPGEVGVIVLDAPSESQAAKSGLRPGDVILKCAGTQIESLDDLMRARQGIPAGQEVTLEVFRGQQRMELQVPVGRP
ncbi:MAG TPA: PDZ domain-containing protein [Sedimentisphaerales bacterium]|nr:PDZ domain-containing protein [Sedimentisphaerales bacterium]HNU31120.1 PDZ domain-containing protein [Sedimentisphaerales bacterium]